MLKESIKKDFALHARDTGSTGLQIATLTERIQHLIKHMKEHKKDFGTKRGLQLLVGQRRKLQKYLEKKQPEKYKELIQRLGLRK